MNRKYDREFKLEAVRMAQEAGTTAVEVEERLWDKGMVSRWKRQLVQQGVEAFPGTGHLREQDEESRQLKRELGRVTRERDILKNRRGFVGATCGGRNSCRRLIISGHPWEERPFAYWWCKNPVKKPGPGISADLTVVTPSGDPV
jgi:transposase